MTPINIYGLGGYNTKQIQEFARVVSDEGLDSVEIFARRPDAAPNITETIKSLGIENAPYIIPDALAGNAGIEVVKAFTLPQLEYVGIEGDGYLKETIKIKMAELFAQKPNDEDIKQKQSYITYSPAWQA
jgi:hypothetical protein